MLEYLCRLCCIVGGPVPLRLGDAEIANEVEQSMAVKLRQERLRDFQSVIEAHVRHSGTDPLRFPGNHRQVEAANIVPYPRIMSAESVELG